MTTEKIATEAVPGSTKLIKPKAAKAKAAPKPKTEKVAVERVPAADMVALLSETGLTKSQLAKAAHVSPSLVSEWFGMGRGQLMHRDRFAAVAKAAMAFAKGLK